jgi:hypothetical protein
LICFGLIVCVPCQLKIRDPEAKCSVFGFSGDKTDHKNKSVCCKEFHSPHSEIPYIEGLGEFASFVELKKGDQMQEGDEFDDQMALRASAQFLQDVPRVFGLIGVLVVHCLGMASNSKN